MQRNSAKENEPVTSQVINKSCSSTISHALKNTKKKPNRSERKNYRKSWPLQMSLFAEEKQKFGTKKASNKLMQFRVFL